jgi:hypothetical protein
MKSSPSPKKEAFDPQAFLAKVADGQTVTNYVEVGAAECSMGSTR